MAMIPTVSRLACGISAANEIDAHFFQAEQKMGVSDRRSSLAVNSSAGS
jgi:hypothetical protein